MLEYLINKIIDKKVTIFCGAGISYNSGVPLVNEIKDELLTALEVPVEEVEILKSKEVPFEQFMETIIENSEPDNLYKLFDLGDINENHNFLALLASSGLVKTIVTTNFDQLIEKALAKQQVAYEIFFNEVDFDKIDWKSDKLNLIKIHGSIHDKTKIAVTIKRIAQQKLFENRKKVIQEIVEKANDRVILVLGYSCSDKFDITPAFETIKNPSSEIIFIKHNKNIASPYLVSEISQKEKPNPFIDYKGFVVEGNTDDIIKELLLKIYKRKDSKIQNALTDWKPFIRSWIEDSRIKRNDHVKPYIIGQLFNLNTRYNQAIYYFKSCIGNEKDVISETNVDVFYSLGRAYRDIQTDKEKTNHLSRKFLYKALKETIKLKLIKKQSTCWLSLGVAYEDKLSHYEAIKCYENSKRLAEKVNDLDVVAICLGNIGIVLKNMAGKDPNSKNYYYNKAIFFQKRSLVLSNESGDIRSEGRTYGNIGIAYSLLRNNEMAISNYQRALTIAEELGDIKHQGIWQYNIGFEYLELNLELAEKHIKTAIDFFVMVGGLSNYIQTCETDLRSIETLRAKGNSACG